MAPQTQALPLPRATTAAWLIMPPREVRMPLAACMPWMASSSGYKFRTRMRPRRPRHLLGVVGAEHDLAGDGARGGRRALGDDLAFGLEVERRVQELVERAGVDPADRLLPGDQPLARHVDHRDLERGRGSAFAATESAQDVELAALDRELDVLHLAVVPLGQSNTPLSSA